MPRDKFLLAFNEEKWPIPTPLTRDLCFQNNLHGAMVPEVFGFRTDEQSGPAHLAIVDRAIEYFHRCQRRLKFHPFSTVET